MSSKDWTGNKKSTFVTLGASNHTDKERQREDYYATDPIAARLLLEAESFGGGEFGSVLVARNIWRRCLRMLVMMLEAVILSIGAEMRCLTFLA